MTPFTTGAPTPLLNGFTGPISPTRSSPSVRLCSPLPAAVPPSSVVGTLSGRPTQVSVTSTEVLVTRTGRVRTTVRRIPLADLRTAVLDPRGTTCDLHLHSTDAHLVLHGVEVRAAQVLHAALLAGLRTAQGVQRGPAAVPR